MLPILLLLMPPLHYGEGQCCPNFRRWCRRYASRILAVGVAVPLPKMVLYLTRTFTQLSDGNFVSFCGTNTLLLLLVGAPRHYFCLPRSLTPRTPLWPRLSTSSPLLPLCKWFHSELTLLCRGVSGCPPAPAEGDAVQAHFLAQPRLMRHGGLLLGRSSATLSLPRARLTGPGRRTGLSTAPRDTALPGRNRSVR